MASIAMSKESQKGSNFLIKELAPSVELEKEKALKMTFFLSSIREATWEFLPISIPKKNMIYIIIN